MPYGLTRTIVGFGSEAAPEYATDPRYFVPGVRPENARVIVPVVPIVAEAGAVDRHVPGIGGSERPRELREARSACWNREPVDEPRCT